MFLTDRINLENELLRQSNYLRILAERMEVKRTDEDVELKVLTMEKICKLNHRLLSEQNADEHENPAILLHGVP